MEDERGLPAPVVDVGLLQGVLLCGSEAAIVREVACAGGIRLEPLCGRSSVFQMSTPRSWALAPASTRHRSISARASE
eukprot:3669431-Alexandrium_andersonii.AAC.1